MSNEKHKRDDRSIPVIIAVACTLAVTIIALISFSNEEISGLKRNELGDFFAGFAGALSFIWIIAAIFLQKEELSLQRREIRALAEESANQSKALLSAARSDLANRWPTYVEQVFRKFGNEVRREIEEVVEKLIVDNSIFGEVIDGAVSYDGDANRISFLHDEKPKNLVVEDGDRIEVKVSYIRDVQRNGEGVYGEFLIEERFVNENGEFDPAASKYAGRRSVMFVHVVGANLQTRLADIGLPIDAIRSYVREAKELDSVFLLRDYEFTASKDNSKVNGFNLGMRSLVAELSI